MNVLMLLKNKEQVEYIYDSSTLRQGLEKMKAHGYTAIPVLSNDGKYIGSVSEGDFLWHILACKNGDIKNQENYQVKDIIRHDFNPAVKVTVAMDEVFQKAIKQNYIPVVDDRNYFIGIVTRQALIKSIINDLD